LVRGPEPRNPTSVTVGQPFGATVVSSRRNGVPVPIRLTVLRAEYVGQVTGAGTASGKAFTAPGGFVAVGYRIVNLGTRAVDPFITVSGQFGLSGGFGGLGVQAGSFDRGCALATTSYASEAHIASPDIELGPADAVDTVALYPLRSRPTSVTAFTLGWSSYAAQINVPLGGALHGLGTD
jgi:hypothetical protein